MSKWQPKIGKSVTKLYEDNIKIQRDSFFQEFYEDTSEDIENVEEGCDKDEEEIKEDSFDDSIEVVANILDKNFKNSNPSAIKETSTEIVDELQELGIKFPDKIVENADEDLEEDLSGAFKLSDEWADTIKDAQKNGVEEKALEIMRKIADGDVASEYKEGNEVGKEEKEAILKGLKSEEDEEQEEETDPEEVNPDLDSASEGMAGGTMGGNIDKKKMTKLFKKHSKQSGGKIDMDGFPAAAMEYVASLKEK